MAATKIESPTKVEVCHFWTRILTTRFFLSLRFKNSGSFCKLWTLIREFTVQSSNQRWVALRFSDSRVSGFGWQGSQVLSSHVKPYKGRGIPQSALGVKFENVAYFVEIYEQTIGDSYNRQKVNNRIHRRAKPKHLCLLPHISSYILVR